MVVTPANIADQPHGLAIDSQVRDGEMLFAVTIRAKKDIPFEDGSGTPMIVSSGRTVGTVRLHAGRVKNLVTFECLLARDATAESILRVDSATATTCWYAAVAC